MPNLREELGDLWRSIHREMHDSFRQAFRELDVPPIFFILLRKIEQEPGVTMSELARRSGTVKSHVSKMVDQLVQQGYVEKRPDPDDQRLVRLHLTKAAADMKAAMEARVQTVLTGMVGEIPEEEFVEIIRGLRTLLKALQKSNEKVNP